MDKLRPCLCGNFGDDGPDDYCTRPCECEVCGKYEDPTHERCGMKVCADCATKERWLPTITLYPTRIQAWADQRIDHMFGLSHLQGEPCPACDHADDEVFALKA